MTFNLFNKSSKVLADSPDNPELNPDSSTGFSEGESDICERRDSSDRHDGLPSSNKLLKADLSMPKYVSEGVLFCGT